MAPKSTQPVTTVRLLDVDQAAAYLGVSVWTVRSLIADKHLSTVKMPSVKHRGETTRRVLLDVRDLDAAVDRWRSA
jgi:excisionase family DNA binding protein